MSTNGEMVARVLALLQEQPNFPDQEGLRLLADYLKNGNEHEVDSQRFATLMLVAKVLVTSDKKLAALFMLPMKPDNLSPKSTH